MKNTTNTLSACDVSISARIIDKVIIFAKKNKLQNSLGQNISIYGDIDKNKESSITIWYEANYYIVSVSMSDGKYLSSEVEYAHYDQGGIYDHNGAKKFLFENSIKNIAQRGVISSKFLTKFFKK